MATGQLHAPGRFTPVERAPGTHWRGGWVNPRVVLDDVKKRKFLTLPGLELGPLGRPASSQSLYRLRYPCSMIYSYKGQFSGVPTFLGSVCFIVTVVSFRCCVTCWKGASACHTQKCGRYSRVIFRGGGGSVIYSIV
jgi:hypothetical protein